MFCWTQNSVISVTVRFSTLLEKDLRISEAASQSTGTTESPLRQLRVCFMKIRRSSARLRESVGFALLTTIAIRGSCATAANCIPNTTTIASPARRQFMAASLEEEDQRGRHPVDRLVFPVGRAQSPQPWQRPEVLSLERDLRDGPEVDAANVARSDRAAADRLGVVRSLVAVERDPFRGEADGRLQI